jgi:hypothetical protein
MRLAVVGGHNGDPPRGRGVRVGASLRPLPFGLPQERDQPKSKDDPLPARAGAPDRERCRALGSRPLAIHAIAGRRSTVEGDSLPRCHAPIPSQSRRRLGFDTMRPMLTIRQTPDQTRNSSLLDACSPIDSGWFWKRSVDRRSTRSR